MGHPLRVSLLLLAWILQGCGGGSRPPVSPIDLEFGRLEETARGAFERRDLSYAERTYEQLLLEARRTDEPGKLADAAYNLAAVRFTLGKLEEARPALAEARHELVRAGRSTTDLELLQARVELALGDSPATLLAVEAALGQPDVGRLEAAEAHVLAGLASLAAGDEEAAAVRLERAEELSEGELASVERLRARLLTAGGEIIAAAEALDQEAALRRERSEYDLMAGALEQAGLAWAEAGELPRAADRLYRAARVQQAQGQSLAALTLLRSAEEAAAAAGGASGAGSGPSPLQGRIADLRAELVRALSSEEEALALQQGLLTGEPQAGGE